MKGLSEYERMQVNTLSKLVNKLSITRRTKTITIDPRVWDVVQAKAKKQGIAASRWLENYLFDNFKNTGDLAMGIERLGELRGGDQKRENP